MDRRVTIILGATFLAYASASLLWSSDPVWGGVHLLCLTLGIPLAWAKPRLVWLAFLSAVWLSMLTPILSFDYLPYGPFANPNFFGCAITLALAGTVAYSLTPWLNIPFLLAGLAYCQSRGAIVAAAVPLCAWLWRWNRPAALIIVTGAIAAVFYLGIGRFESVAQRLGIWHDTSAHLTLFGHGLGSFYNDYWAFPIHTNVLLAHANHAYNDFLELVFLFGIGTIPLWFFLANILPASTSEARLIFTTFCALGLSFFPLFLFPLNTLAVATIVRALMEQRNGSMAPYRTALHQRSRYRMGV